MRKPTEREMELIRLVAGEQRLNHDDPRLSPFCDDASTLTKPDVFNACHDLGWLRSTHDHDTSNSYVRLTDAGRDVIHRAFVKARARGD